MSRTQKGIYNALGGVFGNFIIMLFSFIVRTVYIYVFGKSFVGLNGVFTEILTVLSLVELGFGTAISYLMYKPLLEQDEDRIKAIMYFFKKIYFYIGLVVLTIGLIILPLLKFIIKTQTSLDVNIYLVFLFYLAESVSSYFFFAYKSTILVADQKNYIIRIYDLVISLFISVIQILCLLYLRNFYLYILLRVSRNIILNLLVSKNVDKNYPYLNYNTKEVSLLPDSDRQVVFKDIFALGINKFSNIVLNSTDNIVISSNLGIVAAGMYSNYAYILTLISTTIFSLFNPLIASIGNLYVEGKIDSRQLIFNRLRFLNYVFVAFSSACLASLINIFIEFWIGSSYLLSSFTVYTVIGAFFVKQMGIVTNIFRLGSGVFQEKKYAPLISALVNLFFSILLVRKLGIAGVFIGTIISSMITNLFVDPLVVYENILKRKPIEYYKCYLQTLAITLILIYISKFIVNFFVIKTLFDILLIFGLVITVNTLLLILITYKTEEFKYYKILLNNIIKK